MSFEPTYQTFFESLKYGHGEYGDNEKYVPIQDGITPEKDGFYPGFLPEVWGTTPDTRFQDCNLSRYKLKSLKNLPKSVPNHSIWVSHNLITNLIGMPSLIGGSCHVSENPNLSSLDGFPSLIKGDFKARECPKLTPLEFARVDAGSKVEGDIYWSAQGRTSILDKTKCTRAYYDLMSNTAQGEQEDITEI